MHIHTLIQDLHESPTAVPLTGQPDGQSPLGDEYRRDKPVADNLWFFKKWDPKWRRLASFSSIYILTKPDFGFDAIE
jgi:hypothetical protein